MKKHGYSIAVVLMVIMIAVAAVGINILPEEIPMHFNAAGEADRIGNKLEVLILPLLSVVCGSLMLVLSKRQGKKENGSEKAHLIAGNIILLFLNVFQVYFLWMAYTYTEAGGNIVMDSSLTSIILGAMFMLIGNFLPKVTRNRTLGIKLPWTLKNDVCWQKSHRFGGVVFVITGLLLIASGLIFNTTACAIAVFVIMVAMLAVTSIGTFVISKKVEDK